MIEKNPAALIAIFAQSTLAMEFQRLGYGAAVNDLGSMLDDELALHAATHIRMGRMKLSDAARAKAETLHILDGNATVIETRCVWRRLPAYT